MSVRLMTIVWALDLPATDKMVLLALADAANDDGVTWIALKSRTEGKYDLTVKCSLSKRAIQLAIGRLCDGKLLTRLERPGRGVIYTVTPKGGAQDAPVHDVRPAPDAPAGAPRAPKPSIPVISEAKASSQRVIDHWNGKAKPAKLPESRVQDAGLRQKIRLRVKEHGEALVLEAITRLVATPWLRGEGRDSNWRPTLDWLLTPANFRKVLEGAYGEDPKAELPPAERIKEYESRAKWFRNMDREEDASRCLALAANLRAAAASETDRRFAAVPAGTAAARIVGSLRPQ